MIQILSAAGSFNFIIKRDERKVAELIRKGWITPTTKAKVNEDEITFISASLWGGKYDILKNARKCGKITCHWTGKMKISLYRSDGKGQDTFTLKNKEWFGGGYELRDTHDQPIFGILGKFSWSNWKTHYTVEEFNHPYPEQAVDELLVYCAYALKVHANQSTGI